MNVLQHNLKMQEERNRVKEEIAKVKSKNEIYFNKSNLDAMMEEFKPILENIEKIAQEDLTSQQQKTKMLLRKAQTYYHNSDWFECGNLLNLIDQNFIYGAK